jgi:hypothetical protein
MSYRNTFSAWNVIKALRVQAGASHLLEHPQKWVVRAGDGRTDVL